MDQKLFNLTVFIDLKKAFDTVNHEILLEKLLLLGITGSAFQLLELYLSDRSQKCEVKWFHFKRKENNMRSTTRLNSRAAFIFIIYQ